MIYITITYIHIYLCYISNDFYNSYVLINFNLFLSHQWGPSDICRPLLGAPQDVPCRVSSRGCFSAVLGSK